MLSLCYDDDDDYYQNILIRCNSSSVYFFLLLSMNRFKWQSLSFEFGRKKAKEKKKKEFQFYSILTGHTMRSKFDHKLLLDHFHKNLSAMSLFSLFVFLCCYCHKHIHDNLLVNEYGNIILL